MRINNIKKHLIKTIKQKKCYINMRKKTKIITISLIGFLLLVPFMRPSRAQVPAYVGVAEGEHHEWDFSVYVGEMFETWNQWFADNMTDHWAYPFGQTMLDNMTSTYLLAAKIPIAPQVLYFYTIDSIQEDTGGFDLNFNEVVEASETFPSPGETLVNMSSDLTRDTGSGSFMDFPGWPYWRYFVNGTTIFIGNDTARFAEDMAYGALAFSPIWATNFWNWAAFGALYNPNTFFFAPNNVNWTEFAILCNAGLEAMFALSANWSYTLTVSELSNGFEVYSPIMGFGNNSEAITITTTYDSNGLMEYHSWEYGTTLLLDIAYGETTDPVVDSPSDFSVVEGYTGVNITWTATDANPLTYAVIDNETGTVVSPSSWTSGVPIVVDIPEGYTPGHYLITINLQDERGNLASDSVIMTVTSAPTPPEPPIPGYELPIVLGVLTIGTIGIIILVKKKK
jgi:hypothetical protein